jgi:phage terminase large subunit
MPSAPATKLEITPEQGEELRQRFRDDPSFFFRHVLGIDLWPVQLEIVLSVRDNRITTVASCHAIGKSFTASAVAAWYLSAYPDSILVSTAPTFRQVQDILWREMNGRYEGARVPLGGKMNQVRWNLGANWFGVGLSTNDPDRFQGYHAKSGRLLVIGDESAGIPEPIFEAVDAVLTSEDNRLLMIGNPTSSSGSFFESHRPGYPAHKIKVDAFKTPNFTYNNIRNEADLILAMEGDPELGIEPRKLVLSRPYLISPIWVYERIKKWGIESPVYEARVLANFPTQGEDTLIPLNWIEAAATEARREGEHIVSNGQEKFIDGIDKGDPRYGIDVARFGSDRTVITHRLGNNVQHLATYSKEDTMQTTGRIQNLLMQDYRALAMIDVIGVGAGVVDRLMEIQREIARTEGTKDVTRIIAVNVAEACDDDEDKLRFVNKRALYYWRLRELFEKGNIAIPNDEELIVELSAIKFKYDSSGRMLIEKKEDMKKRLLKSPDKADSLMLSFAGGSGGHWLELPRELQGNGEPAPAREKNNVQQPISAGLKQKRF